jgi:hypothetical protein
MGAVTFLLMLGSGDAASRATESTGEPEALLPAASVEGAGADLTDAPAPLQPEPEGTRGDG